MLGRSVLGLPTGADNESIDADLARAYASENEGQGKFVLLDTSGLLCYIYQNEPQHQEAVQ